VSQLRTNPEDVYVWMDIFCVNQHLERSPSELPIIKEILQVRQQGGMARAGMARQASTPGTAEQATKAWHNGQ